MKRGGTVKPVSHSTPPRLPYAILDEYKNVTMHRTQNNLGDTVVGKEGEESAHDPHLFCTTEGLDLFVIMFGSVAVNSTVNDEFVTTTQTIKLDDLLEFV